jgi:hypothetical protein
VASAVELTRPLALAAGLLAVGAALVVPVRPPDAASWAPIEAAERAETQVPSLGLPWGRLRGWRRSEGGWLLAWQPAHGAWLLQAYVPDGPGRVMWRLDVASWLPGARLSRAAAALLMGFPTGPAVAEERLARRDWRYGSLRLSGALPAGTTFVTPAASSAGGNWDLVLGGLLFAGMVARMIFPAILTQRSRRIVAAAAAALLASTPWLAPLAEAEFRVGVRPWVTQLVAAAVVALVLGAVIVAVMSLPAGYARPTPLLPSLTFAAGFLAGRLAPASFAAAIEGLTVRGVALACLVVVGGWLAGLAADGLRQALGSTARRRALVLVAAALVVVATAGSRTGPVLAVLLAAAVARPQAGWAASFTLWGWAAAVVLTTCLWPAATLDGLVLLALGIVVASTLGRDRAVPVRG